MKSQDVMLLAKLSLGANVKWKAVDLAQALGLSQPEVSLAIRRCIRAGLISEDKRTVSRRSLLEFLVYGVKYVFPAKIGPTARGVPTAHSAPIMASQLTAGGDALIWPKFQGELKGLSLEPIYSSAIVASEKDAELYNMLALVDTIRVGRSREVDIAVRLLKQRLLSV